MGSNSSKKKHKKKFSKTEMADYLALTYYTRREIKQCFQKFRSLDPSAVDQDPDVRLPAEAILCSHELKVNPYADRLLKIFSSSHYGDGAMTFDDYLDMRSAFSPDAPVSVKAEYAFKIFDFDEDEQITQDDIEEALIRLLGEEELLSKKEIEFLVKCLQEEVDLDNDGGLALAEFEHVVAKSTDFVQAFTMRL